MIVVRVTSPEINERTGKRRWILFETKASGIEEIVRRLNAGEMIYGFSLFTRLDPSGSNVREVVDAREITLTREEVHQIQQPSWQLVRYEQKDAGA